MNADTSYDTSLGLNWRHVGAFLGLTFGLTWLLDLAIYLRGGLGAPGALTVLQLQMLMPAFSAIVLGLFFFQESPIYRGRSAGRGRWFYYYYIVLTIVYAVGTLVVWVAPAQEMTIAVATISQVLAFLGLPILIVLRLASGRETMSRVRLTWGKWRFYLLFGLGVVVFYSLQAALNAYFGLGPAYLTPMSAPQGMSPDVFLIVAAVQSVLLAPILAIVIAFGEEYGWRGYLQSELLKLGRVRGVLVLGIIWGVWHWPVILMGHNYPGYPLQGVVLMTLYCMGLGIVLSYAVLKSGSVLLASYLHALNNQVASFIMVFFGLTAFDPVLSFGIGVYGIATLAIVALLVLRDRVWRSGGSALPLPRRY